MRHNLRPIVLLIGLVLPAVTTPGYAGTLPDSVKGIPQARFMEFWSTYMVSTLHYGDENVPNRIVGFFGEIDSTQSPVNAVLGFLETNRDIFRMHDVQSELVLDTIKTDDNGGRTVVLQQVCQGRKVIGCHLQFLITPTSSIELITGRYLPNAEVSGEPKIHTQEACEIARDSLQRAGVAPVILACQPCVLPYHRSFRLAWEIVCTRAVNATPPRMPIYIDAESGDVLPAYGW